MANITNEVNVHDGAVVTNWISQINAGGTIYDIATHHGITFREGNGGATTTWNGLSDIEVVIPSITDIVQTPIEFAGTVGANGVISWNAGHTDGPKDGYLVFVTVDCTFADLACEAGDMAVYANGKWNIVSGENQVKIVSATDNNITDDNRTVVAVGAAKDVLVVEGKALSLTLDYAEIMNHTTVTKGDVIGVAFGDMIVDNAYVQLTQDKDDTLTVGADVNIDVPTKLTDGTVTFNNKTVIKEVNFGTFTQGTLPEFTPNSEKKLDIAGGTLTATSGLQTGDFVDSVSLADVTFVTADDSDANKIKMITSIVAGDGAEFLNGIKVTGEGETASFTVMGYVAPTKGDNTTFVEGLAGNLTPVTSITAGDFKLVAGTDLATGFGAEAASGDVLSSVEVTANNNTSVLNNATVTDHVLSFGSTNVTSGVSVDRKYKSLTKTGFEYTAPKATNTDFVTSGFTRTADVDYTFNTGKETTYTTTEAMWKLNTPDLVITKGGYTINHSNMKATVPANSFVASATQGTLPTWEGYKATPIDLTASVATDLDVKTETIHTLVADLNTITLPGAYHLGSATAAGDETVLVGKAGSLADVNATVDLQGYVTDVKIQ